MPRIKDLLRNKPDFNHIKQEKRSKRTVVRVGRSVKPSLKSHPKSPEPVKSELARNVPDYPYFRTSCHTWQEQKNFKGSRVMRASGARNVAWEIKKRNQNTHIDLRKPKANIDRFTETEYFAGDYKKGRIDEFPIKKQLIKKNNGS